MELDPERRAEWAETFRSFDNNGNGTVDLAEFQSFLQAIDPMISDEEAELGFTLVDKNNNGRVDFQEFINWWTER